MTTEGERVITRDTRITIGVMIAVLVVTGSGIAAGYNLVDGIRAEVNALRSEVTQLREQSRMQLILLLSTDANDRLHRSDMAAWTAALVKRNPELDVPELPAPRPDTARELRSDILDLLDRQMSGR